jgi:hypothetical protein
MSNLQRGIVEFKSGGNTYKIKLDVNALCELEEHFDKSTGDILAQIGQMRMVYLRQAFYAGMKNCNDNITLEGIADIIGQMETPAFDVMERAVNAAFPQEKESSKKPATRAKTA